MFGFGDCLSLKIAGVRGILGFGFTMFRDRNLSCIMQGRGVQNPCQLQHRVPVMRPLRVS